MTDKIRLTAATEINARTTRDGDTTPGVELFLTYDQGDHEQALRELVRAYQNVREQIEETA